MERKLITLFIAGAVALTGCGPSNVTIQRKMLARPNPTNFVFGASVIEVKDAIKRAFNKWTEEEVKNSKARVWKGTGTSELKHRLTMVLQRPPAMLFWKGDADSLAKFLLTKPGNENDAYFYATESPVGESQVYYQNGQPLIYFADFHIHLTEIDQQKTRVEVATYDADVITAVLGHWSMEHDRGLIHVPVDPTTVEEYQILFRIGEQLRAKDMPEVLTPGPDAPSRNITIPLRR